MASTTENLKFKEMDKSLYYKDYIALGKEAELERGFASMRLEIEDSPLFVKRLVEVAIENYKENKFSYDGATFVKERYEHTRFEAAAFPHDMLNGLGYVGYNVDLLFMITMFTLGYPKGMVFRRVFLMFVGTSINVWRHKKFKKKNYKGDININNYLN